MRGTLRDAESDSDGVEAAVGKRHRLGIALDKRDGAIEPALGRALAPDAEHVGVDIDDRRACARAASRRHPKGDVAGAAGEIEQMEMRARLSGDRAR